MLGGSWHLCRHAATRKWRSCPWASCIMPCSWGVQPHAAATHPAPATAPQGAAPDLLQAEGGGQHGEGQAGGGPRLQGRRISTLKGAEGLPWSGTVLPWVTLRGLRQRLAMGRAQGAFRHVPACSPGMCRRISTLTRKLLLLDAE